MSPVGIPLRYSHSSAAEGCAERRIEYHAQPGAVANLGGTGPMALSIVGCGR